MKIKFTNSPPAKSKNIVFALVGTLVLLLPNIGFAVTASNNIITNTVTVDYDDTADTPQTQITDSINVTVELVEATPALVQVTANQAINAGTTATYTYTITSNANGIDTYNLTSSEVTSAGMAAGTLNINGGGGTTTITVGATTVETGITVDAGPATTTIIVPSDSDGADSQVNGIAVNDTVVLGGFTYNVSAITDNGGVAGTSSITVDPDGNTPVLAVGSIIGEQVSFNIVVTHGAISVPATAQTATWTLTAEDDAAVAAGGPTSDDSITTVNSVLLTVTKYVANLTTSVVGTGTSINTNPLGVAADYYPAGVTGKSGDTLSYVIVIVNAGSAASKNVVVTDQIPAFTSYTASTMDVEASGAGWSGALNDGVNTPDAGETDTATVYIYAGTGGLDSGALGAGVGGTLAVGVTTMVSFQVTID